MRYDDEPEGLRSERELLDPPTNEPYGYEGTHEQPSETRPPAANTQEWPFNERKLRSLLDRGERAATIRALTQESVRDQQDAVRRLRTRLESQRGTDGRVHIDAKTAAELARVEGELKRRRQEAEAVNEEALPAIALANKLEQWASSRGWRRDGSRGGKRLTPEVVDRATGRPIDGWQGPRLGGA